jgi:hypothetical protein
MLLGTNNKGRTVWQLAEKWGQLKECQRVWVWAKKLTAEEKL